MKTVKINIKGMSCVSCEQAIAKHFKKINIKAEVSTIEGAGTFYFNEAEWSIDDIMNNIRGLGYKPYVEFHYKKTLKDYLELLELSVAFIITTLFILNMFKMASWIKWAPKFMTNGWVQFILTSFIQLYVGRRFYKSAYHQIKVKKYGMDVLVAFSTSIAYIYSITLLLRFGPYLPAGREFFFETSAEVITFLLIGKIIEANVQRKATAQLRNLLNQQKRKYTLISGKIKEGSELIKGDRLILKAGQKIPSDAKIVSGISTMIDESSITGESIPVKKQLGDSLLSGSINVGGTIHIEITVDAKNSSTEAIANSMRQLQRTKPNIAKLVDKISNVFVPGVLVFIGITFLAWLIVSKGSASKAIYYSIAVAVVACPCALGLATPMSIVSGATRAVKEDILYNKADVFEKFKKVDVVAFDKTGTITKGELFIDEVIGQQRQIDEFTSLEIISMHPIAKAFMNYKDSNKDFQQHKFNNYEEIIGSGVKGMLNNKEYIVGSHKFVTSQAKISDKLQSAYNKALSEGNVIVIGAIDKEVVSIFVLRDQVKETTKLAIEQLHAQGIKTIMITGDNTVTAQHIAKKLNIDDVFAEVKPLDKKDIIKKLQQEGKVVAFAGDGVNDAVALSQANLSIAMGSGSDIAQSNSDITLLNSDLLSISKALYISKRTLRNIYQNLGWAFIWNGTMIPLAAFGFLKPWVAALAMSVESLVVVLNATRLNFIKLGKEE